ncbi:MAG TPA: PilZ domain-containing protein [bacterium]|nr:PilZ domain-containing protein [bacterium]
MIFQKSIIEKRTHSRLSVQLPIQYRLLNTSDSTERYKGRVALGKDLSQEGIFLKIAPDKEVQAGEVVRLDITLPEIAKHLFAFGEIIWVNRLGAGVRLMLMPDEDRQYLNSYLDQIRYS